jgi:hypothetical protein
VAPPPEGDELAAAERWLVAHGLPWFVDDELRRVRALLTRRSLARVVAACLLVGAVAGAVVGWLLRSPSTGGAVAATVAGLALAGWAGVRLDLDEVARWAGLRTLRQVGLLLPLATRALPLLLIFTVFFFINTEVWQVASAMAPGVLWLSVLLFAGIAVVFLLARLPEEVDRVVAEVRADGVGQALAGTPLAGAHLRAPDAAREVPLTRLQKVNLLLVLLVVQAGQVLLLALAVFAFFTLFGAVAVTPQVVESWLGAPPTGTPVSVELLKVSVFLAAFSGLYFTVSAVTDATYRDQFFTQITDELQRAVGVRAVYAAMREEGTSARDSG